MSLQPSSYGGGVDVSLGGSSGIVDAEALQREHDDENMLSDDDNAADDNFDAAAVEEKEDPLLLAIDDLEGRIVAAVDEVKLHPGIKTSPDVPVHQELATLLRPVVEVGAHTGPSIARTYYQGIGVEGVEASVEDVYQRVVSDLVLPVLLEMAQCEGPSKRVASLEFFKTFWNECHKAGSWLDTTTVGMQAGPYGSGGQHGHHHGHHSHHHLSAQEAAAANTPAARAALKRRRVKRLAREGEILRYWVQASIACTTPGVFTSDDAEGVVASRGILAASASLRPSLRHIAQRIKDADDRGANRCYGPVMKMLEQVLKKLFLSANSSSISESMLSACIKFLEIVILCCSRRSTDDSAAAAAAAGGRGGSARRSGHGGGSPEDFSLDDLPAGHPIITREALESIAEYAFTTLRGLTLMGGQVKIDINILSDMILTGGDGSPSSQVVSILKPAALAYLEIESNPNTNLSRQDGSEVLEYELPSSSTTEYDFLLSQKSYTLTINALATLAVHRPVFFKEAAIAVARKAVKPPIFYDPLQSQQQQQQLFTRSSILAITSHLKATCLTLLRNALSVSTNAWDILHTALKSFDMELQADKALQMARQATALKTAGRAARYRANMYYEWDASESAAAAAAAATSGGAGSDRVSKRQRETDDALAKMRAAKAARGLGNGIQLPTSMTDAAELVLQNLAHLPAKRPTTSSSSDKKKIRTQITLDFVVDAIMTGGASLSQEEGRWYDRDGGAAWSVDIGSSTASTKMSSSHFFLEGKLLETLELIANPEAKKDDEDAKKRRKLFYDQCNSAAADAMARVIRNAAYSRSKSLADLGNRIAARLAFKLQGTQPSSKEKLSLDMAKRSAEMAADIIACGGNVGLGPSKDELQKFVESYPMVACGLALEATASADPAELADVDCSVSGRMIHEAMVVEQQWLLDKNNNKNTSGTQKKSNNFYERSLDVFVASAVCAGKRSHEKPSDNDRKRAAARAAANLQRELVKLPRLTRSSLLLVSAMCDIEEIKKKATDAARKTSQDSIAASAAAHAAMVAAEKRATAALLILRDAAFQFDSEDIRKCALECAVCIASGRFPSIPSIQDKALKLVMNVFYSRTELFASFVVEAATSELQFFSQVAVEAHDSIEKANKAQEKDEHQKSNQFSPQSDEEKGMMERLRKPAVLYMALCMRQPESIGHLFHFCSVDKAQVLSKTVRVNMGKLARASAAKHGAAAIALKVANMSGEQETPMLLSFLENLAPSGSERGATEEASDIIEACIKIQESKPDKNGKKDPRFMIPVVSIMKRKELETRLPEFVAADDKVFIAALVRMGDRQQRQALLFRDEPDEENPTLIGMTLCEQLVFLHRLDFSAAGLPQKRYLAAIKLCLEDDDVYNDRILMSALDHLSGTFLTGTGTLPLAFMRTVILTCTKHESLHSWICHVLLPRLVEGKIYADPRQWEGWMRCAHMLEKSGDEGVNSLEAVHKLPPDQLLQYKTKWTGK